MVVVSDCETAEHRPDRPANDTRNRADRDTLQKPNPELFCVVAHDTTLSANGCGNFSGFLCFSGEHEQQRKGETERRAEDHREADAVIVGAHTTLSARCSRNFRL